MTILGKFLHKRASFKFNQIEGVLTHMHRKKKMPLRNTKLPSVSHVRVFVRIRVPSIPPLSF
jgi:hypothetical protein